MRLLLATAALLLAGQAQGHDAPTGWAFDSWCCQGNSETGDCQRIPDQSVSPAPGGVRVVLKPGDHPMVTEPHSYLMEMSKVRFSPDGRVYACLYPSEADLRCLYIPNTGS